MRMKKLTSTKGVVCAAVAALSSILPAGDGPSQTAYNANIAAGMKTPETSTNFVKHVDKRTNITSYFLKPGLMDDTQQSWYFTAKSMTDDGRYLVFDYSDDEFRKDAKGKPILPDLSERHQILTRMCALLREQWGSC